jgi:hypothetical protein
MRMHGGGWAVAAIFAWVSALALLLPPGASDRGQVVSGKANHVARTQDRR